MEAVSNKIFLAPLSANMEAIRFEAVSESQEFLHERFSWCVLPYDKDQNKSFLEQAEKKFVEGNEFFFSVMEKASSVYLGEAAIDWIAEDKSRINIVYWIRKSQQGRGYATEALQLLLQHASRLVGAERAEINIETDNVASKRVAEKIGAEYRHEVKNDLTAKGTRKDILYFHYHFHKAKQIVNY